MDKHSRLNSLLTFLILANVVAGCAVGRQAYNLGRRAELARDYDAAMEHYRTAAEQQPENIEYQLKFEQTRFAAAFAHFQQGRRALEQGNLEKALEEFSKTLEIDPTHSLAKQEHERASAMIKRPPGQAPEPPVEFPQMKERMRTDPSIQLQLKPKITGPISLRLVQESRVAFETLAELAGLNVILDPDFRSTRIPIQLANVDIYEALDILALQTRSFWKPINKSTILISPDNQQKRREYEEHILKTIYLTNSVSAAEITEATTALRTLLNMRYIVQSTTMNAIIIRDTPDRIAIAEKIIEDIDKSKPEVVVEALLLEVDRNRLRELGILPPQQTNLTFVAPGAAPAGGQQQQAASRDIRLRDIDAINSGNFTITIPDSVVRFLTSDTETRLLQNPRVRATDGKLAQIRIGSRVPVASGSFQPAFVGATGTPVVQFQYIDVGVNLDLTPRVLLNREVSMTVTVQVQAVAGSNVISGVALPVFTNRSVQHEIRLKEGETNVLGGIITDTDSVSVSGIPGLDRIPILKHLFAQERRTRDQTEIIVLLTPQIVRMPQITATNLRAIGVGTEVNTRLRIEPEAAAAPREAQPGPAPAAAAPIPPPQPAPEAAAQPEPRPSAATLTFSPSPASLTQGSQTPLDILIRGTDIFSVELTLAYDGTALAIREVREAGFLSRDGQTVAMVQRIETDAGIARITLERPPGVAGISGDGLLLQLVVEPLRSGESTLRVTEFRIRDARQNVSTGVPIEVRLNVR